MSHISERYPTFVPSVVSIIMLLVSISPIGDFGLSKWAVCGTSIFIAWCAYERDRKNLMFIFILIALFFNPFGSFYLGRKIEMLVVLVILISIGLLRKDKKGHRE